MKETYHPNAYLTDIRNVRPGLRARTSLLDILEKGSSDAKTLTKSVGMPYATVMHHLKLLKSAGIVRRSNGKNAAWTLTGAGQKRLVNPD